MGHHSYSDHHKGEEEELALYHTVFFTFLLLHLKFLPTANRAWLLYTFSPSLLAPPH